MSDHPRYDEALLRIQLDSMPLGAYHLRDDYRNSVCLDGVPVLAIAFRPGNAAAAEGCAAALVHLLNAREQTIIKNKNPHSP